MTCIRCGSAVERHNCVGCTWPYSLDGWTATTRKARRITLDTSCVNAKQEDIYLNHLEQWGRDDFIVLQRSRVLLAELKGSQRIAKAEAIEPHPPGLTIGMSPLGVGPAVLYAAMPDRDVLRAIMFPTSHPLTPNQENDIRHLQYHVQTGGDIFVTKNPNDFIRNGKQAALWSIGIWVFEPEQAVEHLRKYVVCEEPRADER